MTKDDAIYEAFKEVVPFTNDEVTVEVENGDDKYGKFVIVHWNDKQSSKIRYNE
jgi:hypothetical protein